MKEASWLNSENTFPYPIFDEELIFDVISLIGDDLGLQILQLSGLKKLGGLGQGSRA
jgi:hypothetical protein